MKSRMKKLFASDATVVSNAGNVDRGSLTGVDAVADPHVLPFVECPAAVESADRIVGRRITDLRDEVREEFVGITTCTHLNDLLRSLEDVAALASFA